MRFARRALLFLGLLSLSLTVSSPARAEGQSWLMIDTVAQTLQVVQGDEIKHTFHNISVGRNGYSFDHREGDGRTPLGVFNVAWINPNSRFHLFFGLDYPNQQDADTALRRKLIDFDTYFAIRKAILHGELPPQDTPLGGHIGIHGLGNASRMVHETTNWTQGCIALTNEQIDQLSRWVTLGTKVVIY